MLLISYLTNLAIVIIYH